jgi:uncharacterized peroxidase-related enzyme
MPRINALTTDTASAKGRTLLEGVKKSLGFVPNMMGAMAQAPAALQGYLSFSQALGGGALPAGLREQIALAVAGQNTCDYCASAHTAIGKGAGVAADELTRNLHGESRDPKTQAALTFAKSVVAKRGFVEDAELETLRGAGYSDGDIVEIIGNVALNIFTNYFNHIAEPAIDFPEVRTADTAAA